MTKDAVISQMTSVQVPRKLSLFPLLLIIHILSVATPGVGQELKGRDRNHPIFVEEDIEGSNRDHPIFIDEHHDLNIKRNDRNHFILIDVKSKSRRQSIYERACRLVLPL